MNSRLSIFLLLFCINTTWAESPDPWIGPCVDTADTEQWVLAREGNNFLGMWKPDPEEIHKLTMSNGFKLGIQIAPVDDEFYLKNLSKMEAAPFNAVAVPEMVEISLYGMSDSLPKYLTHTYGDTNSIQGYSSAGGATSVEGLGRPGIALMLSKTKCITRADLEK